MKQNTKLSNADLIPHQIISSVFFALLIVDIIFCHIWGNELQINLAEADRILIRSMLYGITIILFPLTKLLRLILLRLNQTMPGDKSAGQRYLLTITVTSSLIEATGGFGLLMFILGDDFNTLYIFTLLAAVGIFLHKPNLNEYFAIGEALSHRNAMEN